MTFDCSNLNWIILLNINFHFSLSELRFTKDLGMFWFFAAFFSSPELLVERASFLEKEKSKIWVKNSLTDFFKGCRQRGQVNWNSRAVYRHTSMFLSIETSFFKISRNASEKKIAKREKWNFNKTIGKHTTTL